MHRLHRGRDRGLLPPLPRDIHLLFRRPHRREEFFSPARTRSGQLSPASSQGSVFWPVWRWGGRTSCWRGAFDHCGIPPVEARSALDHELLGTSPDDPTDPVDVPVVSTPPQTASTSTAPVALVYSRLGPPRDGSGDHTVPPHPDLTWSWRESWEARTPWNLFRLFMHCRKCWSSLHRQLILRPQKNRSIASLLRRVRNRSQHQPFGPAIG